MAAVTFKLVVYDSPVETGAGTVPINSCTLSKLKEVYGGNTNPRLSDYYAGGAFVPNPPPTSPYQTEPIPTSGKITLGQFLGTGLTFTETIQLPVMLALGWWYVGTPTLPRNWPGLKLAGDAMGGGGGGGGGGAWGGPNANPLSSGGGGGGAQLHIFNESISADVGYIDAFVPSGGLGGNAAGGWTGSASSSRGGIGINGQGAMLIARKPTGEYIAEWLTNSGGGGTGGRGSFAYSNPRTPTPGGYPNGGTGLSGCAYYGGDTTYNSNFGVGGQGGSSTFGAGGAGGVPRVKNQGGPTPGGDGTTYGAGGGGGGAIMYNSDEGGDSRGGNGGNGFIHINFQKP